MEGDSSPAGPSSMLDGDHRRLALGVLSVVLVGLVALGLVLSGVGEDDPAAGVRADRSASEVSSTDGSTTDGPPAEPAPVVISPAEPAAAELVGPDEISLAFGGDLLTHLPLVEVAGAYGRDAAARYDFGPMLAPMEPVLGAADIAICHLEVPLARDQDSITGYPAFGAPKELVPAIAAAGYDGCSTASNHSLDQGQEGIGATLDAFDAAKLRHAGTARTAEEGSATTFYEIDGAKVAHLSYAYDFNGYKIPGDAPFAVNQIRADQIKADAASARERGAQLVVLSLHWGTEYQHQPDQYQRDVLSMILPSPDIDVIIGHHAHVVQPIEQVDGTYVVFGLGNQLANQREVPRSDGLTVVVRATQLPDGRYRVGAIDAIPTYIEADTFRVLPIGDTLDKDDVDPKLREDLAASYERTAAIIAGTPVEGVSLVGRSS